MPVSKNNKKKMTHTEWKKKQNIKKDKIKYSESPKRAKDDKK